MGYHFRRASLLAASCYMVAWTASGFLASRPESFYSSARCPLSRLHLRSRSVLCASSAEGNERKSRVPSRFYRVYPVSLGVVDGQRCIILSSAKSMAELQSSSGKHAHSVLCLPTSQPPSAGAMLEYAAKGQPMGKSEFLRIAPGLVNRDGGLYDELPWKQWTVGDPFFAKRDCFERFYGRDYPGQSLGAQNLQGRLLDQDLTEEEVEQSNAGLESMLAALNGYVGGAKTTRGAPYRGAYGFDPVLETAEDRMAFAGYASPYALMTEVIRDQFRASVEAVFLEDAWLLDDAVRVGGAIEMRRMASKASTTGSTSVNIGGFSVPNPITNAAQRRERGLDDRDCPVEGDRLVVDCTVDEALGVALSCSVASQPPCPIFIERDLWASASLAAASLRTCVARIEGSTTAWGLRGQPRLVLELETFPTKAPEEAVEKGAEVRGRQRQGSTTTTGSTVPSEEQRSPFASNAIDSETKERVERAQARGSRPAWDIASAQQFFSMDVRAKASTLLATETFTGKLPRPRKVREDGPEQTLDALLLPLMDEAVRRDVQLKRARRDQDWTAVAELEAQSSASARGKTRRALEAALKDGSDDATIASLRQELALQTALRADVTQDEGDYSRFLDKDDWYERDRRRAMGLDRPD